MAFSRVLEFPQMVSFSSVDTVEMVNVSYYSFWPVADCLVMPQMQAAREYTLMHAGREARRQMSKCKCLIGTTDTTV